MKMEKEVKTTLWVEDAVRVRALFNDFDGDIPKWKEAFFEIWRYQECGELNHEELDRICLAMGKSYTQEQEEEEVW